MDQDRLEKFLREPENLFGPPAGKGYDYVRAAIIVSALALGALSGWCLFTLWTNPPQPVAAVLQLLSVPFYVGAGFFWPFNLLFGWVVAALVWYATLYAAAYLTGLRRRGRAAAVLSATVAMTGWATGAYLALAS